MTGEADIEAITSSADVEAIKAVLTALNEVVQEAGPDFVYLKHLDLGSSASTSCLYVWQGQPDCLAAKVMVKLGFPLERLAELEGQGCSHAFGHTTISDKLPAVFESVEAGYILLEAQNDQDVGSTWGEALDAAVRLARTYGVDFDPRQANVIEETT